jgi:hypothetical protein
MNIEKSKYFIIWNGGTNIQIILIFYYSMERFFSYKITIPPTLTKIFLLQ